MSRTPILIVEQGAALGGAQLGLLDVLPAIAREFARCVAGRSAGPLAARLGKDAIPWTTWPLGEYTSGEKPAAEALAFAARFPAAASRLIRLIREHGARTLYANGPRAFAAAAAAARWTKIPSVWSLQIELNSWKDRALCDLAVRTARPVVLPCSQACLKVFAPSSALRRRARVVYPGVAVPSDVERPAREARPVIGLVGRIHRDKGQDLLLRAAAQVGSACFRLLGKAQDADIPYFRELELLAAKLKPGTVEFRDWVDGIFPEMARLDALAVPSRREALARVILEAFALRVPVVAAAVGGIPEVVEHGRNGLLVPPDDPDALAAAIRRVIEDAALARRLTEAGYQDYQSRWRLERYQSELLAALAETQKQR